MVKKINTHGSRMRLLVPLRNTHRAMGLKME